MGTVSCLWALLFQYSGHWTFCSATSCAVSSGESNLELSELVSQQGLFKLFWLYFFNVSVFSPMYELDLNVEAGVLAMI